MLTVARLDALALANNPGDTGEALGEYLATLSEIDKGNLVALAEMNTQENLVEMAIEADASGNDQAAVFTRVATIIRKVRDEAEKLGQIAADLDSMSTELTAPYELPVVALTMNQEAYAAVAAMQHGQPLRMTRVNGWVISSKRAADNQYLEQSTVDWMRERSIIIPQIGRNWDAPDEYVLSAIGWRAMGCLYTDKTAEVESRVYSVIGTPRDTASARKYRSVTADWRARQARKDVTPGWNRWAEFPITLQDKLTKDGVKTVTVIFESGRPDQPDSFEFFGDAVNADGYYQHTQPPGASLSKTVTERAYDLAADLCRKYADQKKADMPRPVKPAKLLPIEEPLIILDAEDDADELAHALGIL